MDNTYRENILFIKWFPYDKRNEAISSSIGASCHFIHSLDRKKWNVLFRYILQSFTTLKLFYKKNPSLIIVTNPPIVAAFVVLLYCSFRKARFILDSHAGAFGKRWDFLKLLHKYISRRAILNIVTNESHEKTYQEWRAKTFILSDLVFEIPKKNAMILSHNFNIVAICSFSPDEPIEEIIETAIDLSNVNFYITGDYHRVPLLKRNKPDNVCFTGFLPDQEYYDLLHACDLIMVLVNKENTMQQGAYEAVSVKKPMILSDWEILRNVYPKGTVFVNNTKDSIKRGIMLMIKNYGMYKKEIELLYKERKMVWDQKCKLLEELLKK